MLVHARRLRVARMDGEEAVDGVLGDDEVELAASIAWNPAAHDTEGEKLSCFRENAAARPTI